MFHVVIYNQGAQTLKAVPFEHGRPVVVASATYTIVDLRYSDTSPNRTIQASTAASVDAYSGTTQAAAGIGAADLTRVDVDDVTGIEVGDRLLLHNDVDQALIEVREIDSGNNRFYTTAEITDAYPTGAAVSGIEVSATFPSAEAADEERLEDGGGPYAIDWSFDGIAGPVRQIIWLRRTARTPLITVDDLDTLAPQLVQVSSNLFSVDKLIEQATRDFHSELLARDIHPERFHATELARNCVTYRAAYLGYLAMGRAQDDAMLEHFHGRWMGLINTLTIGKPGAGVTQTDHDDIAEDGDTSEVFGLVRLS